VAKRLLHRYNCQVRDRGRKAMT